FGPRWVGDAMAACPDDIPWQRVVNSQGKISRKTNADEQQRLLQQEGHMFIQVKRYPI
nr:MGMT family protein [Acidiferrobacterales bacterium]